MVANLLFAIGVSIYLFSSRQRGTEYVVAASKESIWSHMPIVSSHISNRNYLKIGDNVYDNVQGGPPFFTLVRGSDLIAFVKCRPCEDSWRASERIILFNVGAMRAKAGLAGLSRMKSVIFPSSNTTRSAANRSLGTECCTIGTGSTSRRRRLSASSS